MRLSTRHLLDGKRNHLGPPPTIRLYPTSKVFKKGHRIRVDISSSNFPRFDVNPNTGEPLNDNRRIETAVNTIHHDAAHPSHLALPLVKR